MEWWERDGHWSYELVSNLDSGKGTPQCLHSKASFNSFKMTDYKNPFLHFSLRLLSHHPKILYTRGHTLSDDFPLYASHPDSSELFQGAAGGEAKTFGWVAVLFGPTLGDRKAWDQHQKEWQLLPDTKVGSSFSLSWSHVLEYTVSHTPVQLIISYPRVHVLRTL